LFDPIVKLPVISEIASSSSTMNFRSVRAGPVVLLLLAIGFRPCDERLRRKLRDIRLLFGETTPFGESFSPYRSE
jgi:hypothetical protein